MKVIITNKATKLELEKDDIIEVVETADGLAFSLRNNLSLVFTDNFFPSTAKQLVKGTVDRCQAENGTILINLQDHNTPARIEAGLVTMKTKKEEDTKLEQPGAYSPPPPHFAR